MFEIKQKETERKREKQSEIEALTKRRREAELEQKEKNRKGFLIVGGGALVVLGVLYRRYLDKVELNGGAGFLLLVSGALVVPGVLYSRYLDKVDNVELNGGFLLLGGHDDGLNYLDNVEVYGSDLSFPSLPSLPLNLAGPIAEMTETGVIYVAGGGTSGGSINAKTLMLSSLTSSKWEEVEARMPRPVYSAASVVVGGEIVLVLGGYSVSDGSGRSGSDVIQMLDTSKSLPTWELLSQSKLPEPLYQHSAAVFESQVIILTKQGVTYTTSVSSIICDMKLDWVKGELPGVGGRVQGPSVEVIEGKLVAVLGKKVFTKTTMDSQWGQLKPLPQWKTDYPSIGSVRGNIVIAGGTDDGDKARDTVFMWVEASSEWKEVNSLRIPRGYHATVQLPRGIM